MKILIISQYFWPEAFRINDLAKGLVELGHELCVLTAKPNYPVGSFYPGYGFLGNSEEYWGSIKIYRVPIIPRGKGRGIQLILNYLSFAFFASLRGPFIAKDADIIFVYEPSPITVGIPALVIKRWKKIPILIWVQDLWPETLTAVNAIQSRWILHLVEILVKAIYRACDYILTSSRAYFDPIMKLKVPREKLRYFPQSTESVYQPMDPQSYQDKNTLLAKGFRILFAGTIGIAQDIENIVQTALLLREHRDIKWIFLGDGSKRLWLEQQIQEHNLQSTIYCLGQHPVESMPQFYACADVLLVSLKKDPLFALTVPAKIQSYLSSGKAIVAALDGEGARIIEEAGVGFAVEPGDSFSLSEAILKLKSLNAGQRAQLGSNGIQYFKEHFNRDILLNQLNDWMLELKTTSLS